MTGKKYGSVSSVRRYLANDGLFTKPSNKIKKDRQEGLRNFDGKVKRLLHERNNAGFNKRV